MTNFTCAMFALAILPLSRYLYLGHYFKIEENGWAILAGIIILIGVTDIRIRVKSKK